MKYRTKSIEVEAVHYLGNGMVEPSGQVPEWMWQGFENGTLRSTNYDDPLVIETTEGPLPVLPGWWVIRGAQGEMYPCKPDVFQATYEPVREEGADP